MTQRDGYRSQDPGRFRRTVEIEDHQLKRIPHRGNLDCGRARQPGRARRYQADRRAESLESTVTVFDGDSVSRLINLNVQYDARGEPVAALIRTENKDGASMEFEVEFREGGPSTKIYQTPKGSPGGLSANRDLLARRLNRSVRRMKRETGPRKSLRRVKRPRE